MTHLGADDGQAMGPVFIDMTPINTLLPREMEVRPFYTVYLNPD